MVIVIYSQQFLIQFSNFPFAFIRRAGQPLVSFFKKNFRK
jgi:hypothetical protein